jgi:hypothetical protein
MALISSVMQAHLGLHPLSNDPNTSSSRYVMIIHHIDTNLRAHFTKSTHSIQSVSQSYPTSDISCHMFVTDAGLGLLDSLKSYNSQIQIVITLSLIYTCNKLLQHTLSQADTSFTSSCSIHVFTTYHYVMVPNSGHSSVSILHPYWLAAISQLTYDSQWTSYPQLSPAVNV